ncbi:hypothetical protein SAMN04488569_101025 [Marinilactibacillus piezotolerans]|uniref:DUF3188 domain-containing protein n=1 Tax=Marinilactibacillus piezotolerans TaxID=258723 RepID=A0A1I3WU59_9LACT|nr:MULTISPECIES: DUF3188 domain-containing protein [Marinilactibacillus]SFK10900.1 hypothetical protein SAMN04488569_101025 [Marinilactibacillus piezotolerans]
MSKNGLFLLSIGCLLLLFSVNTVTAVYDILSLVTALTLIMSGIIITIKGKNPKRSRG